MNLLDKPALHISTNGNFVIHCGGCPVVEYDSPLKAMQAYTDLVDLLAKKEREQGPKDAA